MKLEEQNESPKQTDAVSSLSTNPRGCATMDVFNTQLKADASLQQRMDEIERQTYNFAVKQKSSRVGLTGTITIPVVVNVIYKTAAQNISQAQIQSQIDVLNKDFSATNTDVSLTPTPFAPLVSNFELKFVLAGVVRKQSSKTSWGTADAMKSSSSGGIDATSPTTNLNIWVCNIGGGILGYAQFPGGAPATDGVVISPTYFGNTGSVTAPFDKGRTATHEIGHWLNLRHIWGDSNCGNDLVADTPTQQTSNFGCPAFPHVTCSNGANGDLFMNYMDYVNDACMFMFTAGQKTRTRAIFQAGGARASFNP
ncbi:zinc metalloprotease [Pseudarcicella hirudinis]|uniref:zinc metalloprotease n=1 Tax=Pseudarcicella hirudinis TaxID=1079859 RepID=UPI0035E9DE92